VDADAILGDAGLVAAAKLADAGDGASQTPVDSNEREALRSGTALAQAATKQT